MDPQFSGAIPKKRVRLYRYKLLGHNVHFAKEKEGLDVLNRIDDVRGVSCKSASRELGML